MEVGESEEEAASYVERDQVKKEEKNEKQKERNTH